MTGRVVSLSFLNDGVFDLRVKAALKNPAPGRFVHVAVPGFTLRRPISLCGFENGVARLIFAVKGKGTEAMSRLRTGDELDLLGALGNGFPVVECDCKTLLVGGGVGLPPLLYYANTYQGTHTIAGFRTNDHAILTKEFPSIDVCTDDGSSGIAGYPHALLEQLLTQEKYARVLACGPFSLLRAVSGVCDKAGIPCFVSTEERMGCGVGACLVCACAAGGHYRRVCKDGPVFDASDVDWEGLQ